MNRHQKRAQAASQKKLPAPVSQTIEALKEFSEVVENLKPYLTVIKHMAQRIDDTVSVLRDVELRNSSLTAELSLQREVSLRLLQRVAGITAVIHLDTIRALETQIQDEILKESHGQTTEPEPSVPEEDPGPGTQV